MTVSTFVEPTTVAEACQLLADDPWGAKALAGGTSLVLLMRQGFVMPETLVSLSGLRDLRGISVAEDVVRIGARTTLDEVANSEIIIREFPSLAYACRVVGNPRIRNVATIGGNLADADYASDPPACLASLGAVATIAGVNGERTLPAYEVVTGFFENALADGELITEIQIPRPQGLRGASYSKFRSRSSEDRACVGVAARVDFDGDVVADLDVVVGAVAGTPQRVAEALGRARGQRLDDEVIAAIAQDYSNEIEPMDDARGSAGYRRKMIKVFVRRTLEDCRTTAVAREE